MIEIRNPKLLGAGYYEAMNAAAQNKDPSEDNVLYKALTSGTANAGAEFIPEGYSANIIMELYEQSWARQLFGTWVVSAGMKDNIPKFDSKLTEQSANVSSPIDAIPSELTSTTEISRADLTTTEVEIELKTVAVRLRVMRKFLAYNVNGQIETILNQELADAMADKEANLIVNGDTDTTDTTNINYTYNASSNINGVNAATGDNEELLLFLGIREAATGTAVTNGGSAFTIANFRTAFKNIGIYARKGLDKLVFLVSPDLHSLMIGFTQMETLDTYGPKATIHTGEIGKLYGVKVVVTDKMPNTASATLTASTGRRAASANSYTEFALVYTPTVILGVPRVASRTFSVEKVVEPKFDRIELIAIQDFGIAFKWTAAIVRGYYGTA